LKIELLYWAGCPSHPEALELLQTLLAERGLEANVDLREVRTDEEAQTLTFRARRRSASTGETSTQPVRRADLR